MSKQDEGLVKALRIALGPYVFGGRYGKQIDGAIRAVLDALAKQKEAQP